MANENNAIVNTEPREQVAKPRTTTLRDGVREQKAIVNQTEKDNVVNTITVDEVKEIVENSPTSFEKIKDSHGNFRFIGGSIRSSLDTTNYSVLYRKWSLSGSHLMLVFAFKIKDGTSRPAYYEIARIINLPQWVLDKLYAIGGTTTGWLAGQEFSSFGTNDLPTGNKKTFAINKATEDGETFIRIYNIDALSASGSDLTYRIQFDLIIDND